MELVKYEDHIVNFVNTWGGAPLEQLQVRFAEQGNLLETLDKLVEQGTIRRVKFETQGKEKFILLPNDAKFMGWK